jgi:hypothetical protein
MSKSGAPGWMPSSRMVNSTSSRALDARAALHALNTWK